MKDKNVISINNLDSIIGAVNSEQAGIIMRLLLNGMKEIDNNSHLPKERLQENADNCVEGTEAYMSSVNIDKTTTSCISVVMRTVLFKLFKT